MRTWVLYITSLLVVSVGEGFSLHGRLSLCQHGTMLQKRSAKIVESSSSSSSYRLQRRSRGRTTEMKQKFNPREDYYERLGIPSSATLNDIKRAYRRLALKTHPDVNKEPNAAEQFKRVCEAYKILSDADTKRQYDMARGGGWAGAGSSSSSSSSSSWGAGAGAGRSRQWYDQYDPSGYRSGSTGETADSIDDSFSKIFNDLMGTVVTKGGKAIFEDFVSFLEEGVDGFGEDSDSFEEILRSDDLEEIQAEVENLNFVLLKLREKLQRAQIDKMMAESELRTVNAVAARDIRTVENIDKNLEVVEKAVAAKARVDDLQAYIKRSDKRQRKLMLRAEELRWGPGGRRPAYEKYASPGAKGSASTRSNTGGGSTRAGPASSSSSSSSSPPMDRNARVEDELLKLKKQMGL